MPRPLRVPPQLRAFGWLLAGAVAALAALYGGLRLKAELGYSPLHYVIEDALVLAVGLLGLVAAFARFRRARANAAADAAELALAATLERLPAGATRFEARAQPARVVAIGLCALLLLALGASIGAMALSRPSATAFAWSLSWLCIGGAVAWLALRQAPWARPALVLDAEGATHWWRGSVRWADVVGLRMDWRAAPRGRPVPMLFLGLGERSAPGLAARPPAVWTVSLRGLDQLPERIEAAALELRDRVRPPRIPAWHESLPPGLVASLQEGTALLTRMENLEAAGGFETNAGKAEFAEIARQLEANSQRTLAQARVMNVAIGKSARAAYAVMAILLLLGLTVVVLSWPG